MAPTLNGESVTVDLSDGVKIDSANVTTPDIIATNGVIHIIDKVLVPTNFTLDQMKDTMMSSDPDIVDIALSNPEFSMLVSLLQEADLVSALQGDGPFTVFAPTNEAFLNLVTALGITPEQLMAQPDLANVLLYHVVSGKVLSTDLSDGLSAPTLYGESIQFDLTNGVKVNNSNVTSADVMASNGVVHVIDQVLVPSDFVLQDIMLAEEDIPKTGDVSALPFFVFGLSGLAAVGFTKKKTVK
jgi:uncharacterized surface protein with fasciclin (FAS1) repeats